VPLARATPAPAARAHVTLLRALVADCLVYSLTLCAHDGSSHAALPVSWQQLYGAPENRDDKRETAISRSAREVASFVYACYKVTLCDKLSMHALSHACESSGRRLFLFENECGGSLGALASVSRCHSHVLHARVKRMQYLP
jgi:hypothetical protein